MPYIPDGTVAELPEREWPRPRRLFKWRRRRDQPPFDVPSVHFFGWLSHQIPYFSGPTSPRDLEVLERAALWLELNKMAFWGSCCGIPGWRLRRVCYKIASCRST